MEISNTKIYVRHVFPKKKRKAPVKIRSNGRVKGLVSGEECRPDTTEAYRRHWRSSPRRSSPVTALAASQPSLRPSPPLTSLRPAPLGPLALGRIRGTEDSASDLDSLGCMSALPKIILLSLKRGKNKGRICIILTLKTCETYRGNLTDKVTPKKRKDKKQYIFPFTNKCSYSTFVHNQATVGEAPVDLVR